LGARSCSKGGWRTEDKGKTRSFEGLEKMWYNERLEFFSLFILEIRGNQKRKSPARTQSGHCCTRQQKCFYKYINNKKRTKENLHPLLDAGGNIATKDEEKAEVLNAFYSSGASICLRVGRLCRGIWTGWIDRPRPAV